MNIESIDLNLLVVFDALVRECNVTRAGRALKLSQPATSNALRRLREVLNDPVLVRAGSRMVPTERALALHPKVTRAIGLLREALAEEPAFEPSTSRRRFRVAITDHTAFVLLPLLCQRISQVAPRIVMEYAQWRGAPTLDELEAQQVDLGIGIGDLQHPRAGIHRKRLFPDRFISVVRRGHPAIHERLDLALYLSTPHILVTPHGGSARGVVDEVLEGMGLSRRVAVTVPHFLAAPFVVAHTDFIVTLSEAVSRPFGKFLPLRFYQTPVPVAGGDWAAVWHECTHRHPAHQWLRNEIVAVARNLQAVGSTP